MDASNKMLRYNLYRAYFKNRYLEFGNICQPGGVTFVLKEKLFLRIRKRAMPFGEMFLTIFLFGKILKKLSQTLFTNRLDLKGALQHKSKEMICF